LFATYLKYFIGRKDALIIKEGGKWRRETGTPQSYFKRHFTDPNYFMGSYPIYWNNKLPRCRFICVDLDAHNESESKEDIRKHVDILYSRSEEYFLCGQDFLIVEETDRGYHIWIILKDNTTLKDAWLYVNYIKPKIEEMCGVQEFFPKQGNEGLTNDSYGNGVKLPFYRGENNLIYSSYPKVNKFDIRPFRKEAKKFLNNLSYRKKSIPVSIPQKMPIINTKKGEVPNELKAVYKSPILRPCLKKVIDGTYQCTGAFGHPMRIAVANELLDMNFSVEDTTLAFANQEDFNYTKAFKQVAYSKRKQEERNNSMCFRCETIDKLGFCLDTCPWRWRSATSANHQSTTLPTQLGKEFIQKHLKKDEVESWDELFEVMRKIYKYKKGCFFLIKTTRSGTTTACIAEGLREKKKILMVAPTKKIYDSTVKEATNIYYERGKYEKFIKTKRIKSNMESCKRLHEKLTEKEIKEILHVFPFVLKPHCDTCRYKDKCEYLQFLEKILDYDLIYLTTQKFKALIQSPNGHPLLNKLLKWCDVIFIDEFSSIFSVNYSSQTLINTEKGIDNLDYCTVVLQKLLNEKIHIPTEIKEIIYSFIRRLRDTVYNDFMKRDENVLVFSSFENDKFRTYLNEHPNAWVKIYSAIYKNFRQTKDKSLSYLVMTFLALNSKQVYLQQRFDRYGEREITLAYVDDINSILRRIKRIKNKLLITTDAIIPIVKPDEIFDDLIYVRILDPNKTHDKQKIVVFEGSDPFYKLTKRVKDNITKFLEKHAYGKEAFLIVKNKKVYSFYKSLKTRYETEDWYRGATTVGVKSDLRKMVVLGSPHPPRHSYDFVAKMYRDAGYFKDGEYEKMSIDELGRYFENYDAKSSFFQTISRVKDPMGKEESVVFVYGMPKREVEKYLDLGLKEIKILNYEEYRKEVEKKNEKTNNSE